VERTWANNTGCVAEWGQNEELNITLRQLWNKIILFQCRDPPIETRSEFSNQQPFDVSKRLVAHTIPHL
jgi:hypothetical protein